MLRFPAAALTIGLLATSAAAQPWAAYDPSLGGLPEAHGWTRTSTCSTPAFVQDAEFWLGPTCVPGFEQWDRVDVPLPAACAIEVIFEMQVINIVSGTFPGGCILPGWELDITDSDSHSYHVGLTNSSVLLVNRICSSGPAVQWAVAAMDTTDRRRHYRLLADYQGASLWVDGVLTLTVPAGPVTAALPPNLHRFGDVTSGGANHTRLRDMRYRQGTLLREPPAPVRTCPGGAATFSVSPAGLGPFAYAWRRDGLPINPIANPSAITATLSLADVSAADAMAYDCVVTGPCGFTTSDPATLTICVADFNCDSQIGSQDFFDFLAAFFNNDADINADGQTTSQDFFDFLAAFFGGC